MLENVVAYGVHQVGLPKPYASVDQQRVVGGCWRLGDLHACGSGQLVVWSGNEIFKGIPDVYLPRSPCTWASRDARPVKAFTGRGFLLWFRFRNDIAHVQVILPGRIP